MPQPLPPSWAKLIDYLVVVSGSIYTVGATRPDTHVPAGFNLGLCASVRTAMSAAHGERVAVIAQGSIVDVDMAGSALSDGSADLVEMTRAQIADPDLVAKASAGGATRSAHAGQVQPAVQGARQPQPDRQLHWRTSPGHETTDVEPPRQLLVSVSTRPSPAPKVTVIGAGRP